MIPKIVHQTVRTKDVSWEEARLTKRIRRILSDWEYRLWDNEGQARLIHQIFPHLASRFEAIDFGVARADIARYAMMYEFGGVYLDIDYKLLPYIGEDVRDTQLLLPIELYDQDNPDRFRPFVIGNSILGSAPKQQYWKDLVEYIFETKAPDAMVSSDEIVATTGPVALTDFHEDRAPHDSNIVLAEKNLFQPDISLMGMRTSADARTYGVHLHWGSWRARAPHVAMRILLRRKLNALVS